MDKNCQKLSKIVKLSKLSKIVNIDENCQNCQKLSNIVKNCQKYRNIEIFSPWPNSLKLLLEPIQHVVPRVRHQEVLDARLQQILHCIFIDLDVGCLREACTNYNTYFFFEYFKTLGTYFAAYFDIWWDMCVGCQQCRDKIQVYQ